jgi:molecular chaperone HtpG
MDSSPEPTRHEMKIDLQGLIRLLAKNLYAENDVFVREMVQNAHDSIKKRSALDSRAPHGNIHIRINRAKQTIAFTDNGAGLTEQEIHDYLSTIGRSGTNEFRQDLITKGRQAEVTLIGQFGIGLLSAFVAAYRVEVETLSVQPGSTSWLWSSDGQSDYELQPGQRQEVGTTVTLYVTDSYLDMLLIEELRKAVKKYADFIPYQIFLNDEGVPANAINAPWHLPFNSENDRLKEYTAFVDKRFPDDEILETIPVALRTPYRVDGVLYISDRSNSTPTIEGQLEIYQSRMFVTSKNSHVLPPWAQFINGVIDSPDLTLTASRDAVQQDYVTQEIRGALGQVIVQHLQSMAKRVPEQFELIVLWHSFDIRSMALDYDDFFDAIADLMPFETNRGLMNLRRYCEQSLKLEQKDGYDIFYFSERESASRYYMLCDAKAMLVINAGRVFEELFLKKYAEKRSGVRLHSLSDEGADFLFEQASLDEEAPFRRLMQDFYMVLAGQPIQIRVVHFKPKTIPAITSFGSSAKLRRDLQDKQQSVYISKAMKELLGRVLKEQKMSQISLFLNAENSTIQKMAQMAAAQQNDTIAYQAAIHAIYNNAFLLSSHLMTPEAIQNIFTSSTQAIDLMVEQAEQLTQMQSELSATQLSLRARTREQVHRSPSVARSKQIICVVALPPHDTPTMAYESLLFPALRKVLEFGPYY